MVRNIVFDFGGVLIDWNPRYLYNKLFEDKDDLDYFLKEICNDEWNVQQDGGRSLEEASQILLDQFPDYTDMIKAFYGRWEEMLKGEIKENVDVLYQIDKNKFKLFGLTNWSGETFPVAYEKYPSLREFEGIIVSGDEKMIKPNKNIFELLLSRYNLNAEESLFIDDNLNNVDTAKELGFQTIHLNEEVLLNNEFKRLNIL